MFQTILNTKNIVSVLIRYYNNFSLQKKEGRKREGERTGGKQEEGGQGGRKERKSSKSFTHLGST